MRRCITLLQTASRLAGGDKLKMADVIEVAGVVPSSVVESLFESCLTNSFAHVQSAVNNVIYSGYPVAQVLAQVIKCVVGMS